MSFCELFGIELCSVFGVGRRGHWNQRDDFDGADQVNIYIFYHELGHCLDDRNREVFDREEPFVFQKVAGFEPVNSDHQCPVLTDR
jgi:hypothetical protein